MTHNSSTGHERDEREERLVQLHLEYTRLCADGLITENQHAILENALDVVFDNE